MRDDGFIELNTGEPTELVASLFTITIPDWEGGALATLAAYDLKLSGFNIAEVWTFGSPRVGDKQFAKAGGKGKRSRVTCVTCHV